MDNNKINNQIDEYTKNGQNLINTVNQKSSEFLSNANIVAHDFVDKASDFSDDIKKKVKKKMSMK